MPVMPQKLAGWRIEPPVSVPVAAGSRRAATAAAEPPDEPPGTRARSQGLRTGAEGRVLVARAHRELVAVELAERHRAGLGRAGRRRWRRTGCGSRRASASRRWSAGRAVTKMSLWAIGTPSSGPAVAGARCARRRRAPAPARRSRRSRGTRRAARVRGDAVEQVLRDLDARQLARRAARGRARRRRARAARAHSITFGTRYRPSLDAGALRWLALALVGLGDDVVAQAQARRPAPPPAACRAARRRWCRPRSSARRCERSC